MCDLFYFCLTLNVRLCAFSCICQCVCIVCDIQVSCTTQYLSIVVVDARLFSNVRLDSFYGLWVMRYICVHRVRCTLFYYSPFVCPSPYMLDMFHSVYVFGFATCVFHSRCIYFYLAPRDWIPLPNQDNLVTSIKIQRGNQPPASQTKWSQWQRKGNRKPNTPLRHGTNHHWSNPKKAPSTTTTET